MADLTDVQSAIVSLLAQTLYPNGTANPSAVSSTVKIYPGWPDPTTLNNDLSAGTSHVSVFATNFSRYVPQYMPVWQTLNVTAPTIVVTVAGQSFTLSGTISTPQVIGIVSNNKQYTYSVQSTDTLGSVATGIASLIPGATSSGATVNMPNGSFSVNIATLSTVIREVGRQQQVYQVSVWANSPSLRAQIASLIDPAIRVAERLIMPDSTLANICIFGSQDEDDLQTRQLYVRHLKYNTEYATTQQQSTTTVSIPFANVTPNGVQTIIVNGI